MQITGAVSSLVCLIGLVFVMSLRLPRPGLSEFELRRRKELGDHTAIFGLKRLRALPRLMTIQYFLELILFASFILLAVASAGWLWGSVASFVAILLVGRIARIGLLKRASQHVYRKIELGVITRTKSYKKLLKALSPTLETPDSAAVPDSREELEHLLGETKKLVSPEESELLSRSLRFYNTRVESIMTPVRHMVSIEASEVLGPLVLDRLHKTGHTQFPVTNGDEVVGLLDITDSVTLRRRESPEARDVMRHDMARMRSDEPLDEVLRVLIDVKQPSLLITNDMDEIIGLVSVGDVIRALTGWKPRTR